MSPAHRVAHRHRRRGILRDRARNSSAERGASAASPRNLRIALIDPRPEIGAGVAYATRDYPYPLNVAAGQMSVDSARPGDFLDYLQVTGNSRRARRLSTATGVRRLSARPFRRSARGRAAERRMRAPSAPAHGSCVAMTTAGCCGSTTARRCLPTTSCWRSAIRRRQRRPSSRIWRTALDTSAIRGASARSRIRKTSAACCWSAAASRWSTRRCDSPPCVRASGTFTCCRATAGCPKPRLRRRCRPIKPDVAGALEAARGSTRRLVRAFRALTRSGRQRRRRLARGAGTRARTAGRAMARARSRAARAVPAARRARRGK